MVWGWQEASIRLGLRPTSYRTIGKLYTILLTLDVHDYETKTA